MPDITFEIERDYVSGRRKNEFYPTTDPDEVTVNENCKISAAPVEGS